MELVYPRCCGIDIHKKTIVACLITPRSDGGRQKEIRTFRTVTTELLLCLDWLTHAGCTHVAMESTGVYWKPIYNLFDGHMELLVVNAQHIKAVPGRKTDVRDAEWIADLLQHGLLKGSFIPPAPQRELRELTRYRKSVIEERARAINRLQKTLEDTNIQLGDVATDILGKSAKAMLQALLDGETDPAKVADLALGKLKKKRSELEEALVGTIKPHHRFLLGEQLQLVETLDQAITRISQEIATRLDPPSDPTDPDQAPSPLARKESRAVEAAAPQEMQALPPSPLEQGSLEAAADPPPPLTEGLPILSWQKAIELADTIPGVNRKAAEAILAEIGIDMSRFPRAAHLASWAGMCPGNNESAGKRLPGKTKKGNVWLRQHLVEAAHAAAHTKNTSISSLYHRIKSRHGPKTAIMAVGHSLLVALYHMLTRQVEYQDLGKNYFDEQGKQMLEKRLVRRLELLGYQVSLQPADQAA